MLKPIEHVQIWAGAQKQIGSSISKTNNCPTDIDFDEFKSFFFESYKAGCIGCTIHSSNAVSGTVIIVYEMRGNIQKTETDADITSI